MTEHTLYRSATRIALVTGSILMVPLLAMQFTDEVVWTPSDFAVAGALLFATGLSYQLAARRSRTTAYRAAAGVALAVAFLIVWISLAVGIIGEPGDPANAMYAGVLAVGVVGSIVARFRVRGMARAMFATALAQAAVAVVALISELGSAVTPPLTILALNAVFVALFAGSGVLFRNAARDEQAADPGPAS